MSFCVLYVSTRQLQIGQSVKLIARLGVIRRGEQVKRLLVRLFSASEIALKKQGVSNVGEGSCGIVFVAGLLEMGLGLLVKLRSAVELALIRINDGHVVQNRARFSVFSQSFQQSQSALVGCNRLCIMPLRPRSIGDQTNRIRCTGPVAC